MTAHKIYRAAAEVVRSRICDRPVIPVETLITGLSIPVGFHGRAASIWSAVAKLWGVGEGQLRADDRFAEVCRVVRSDLPDLPPSAWEEAGLKVGLDVHPYDLMHIAERALDREEWEEVRLSVSQDPPSTEEAWVELIMTMTLGEFVAAFSGGWRRGRGLGGPANYQGR